jgi:hypothetical protein
VNSGFWLHIEVSTDAIDEAGSATNAARAAPRPKILRLKRNFVM